MKYTIIHVNDRAKEQMAHNKKILKNFEYVDDIEFFNGNTGNAWDIINHRGIRTDTWSPYDGREFPPLPGEYGVWLSNLNIFNYIIDSNLDSLLVLEDDVVLRAGAKKAIQDSVSELPEGWDFLSFYYFEGQNGFSKESSIGKKYIHKSINQPAANQAMLYSKSGALKLTKIIKRIGIEYTIDCFIYKQAQLGFLNGYSIIPGKQSVLSHEHKKIKSLIDPKNRRTVGI